MCSDFSKAKFRAPLGHNFQLEEIASLTLHPIYMPYLVSVYGVPLLCSSEAGRGEGGGR